MFPFIDPSGYLVVLVAIGWLWLFAWIAGLIVWNWKHRERR